jgi:hypothetical protein
MCKSALNSHHQGPLSTVKKLSRPLQVKFQYSTTEIKDILKHTLMAEIPFSFRGQRIQWRFGMSCPSSNRCVYVTSGPNRLKLGTLKSGMPNPATARSRAWVCSRSLVRIVGSNPAGSMDVCLFSVVCCQRSLRRDGHSSREVLPTVMCMSVMVSSGQ